MIKTKFARRAILLPLVFYVLNLSLFAQNTSVVSVHLQDAKLPQLFEDIKRQVSIDFIYSNDDIEKLPAKNYSFNEVEVNKVISYCLEGSDLTFEFDNNTYIIKPKPLAKAIRGKVVDKYGLPLPGVNIILKEANFGTISDTDGNFVFTKGFSNNIATLHMSFVGMKDVDVAWSGEDITIAMEDQFEMTEEVVITGYQVIDKKQLTSAVSSVEMKDIMQTEAISVDQMLAGKVPGLSVSFNSGEIGVTPKVRVRGVSTLVGNREPLWVLDGVVLSDPVNVSAAELNDPDYVNRIGNAIAGINPQDVERIDVLKDASATALYGARAANGVIVITTKKGRQGKMEVNYTGSTTLRLRPRYTDKSINLMNSKERVQFSRELMQDNHQYIQGNTSVGYEALALQYYQGQIDYDTFQAEVYKLETNNTDWFDLLMRDAWSQSHSLSFSGGNDNTTYRASVGYTDNQGVNKSDDLSRYTVTMDLQHKFNKLSVGINVLANTGKHNYYQSSINPNNYAYYTSRAIPAYEDDGDYSYYFQNVGLADSKGYSYNILNELENSGVEQNNTSITARANLAWEVTDWLDLQSIVSMTSSNTEVESWWGEDTYYAAELRFSEDINGADPDYAELVYGGELGKDYTRNKAYTARIQADMNKYFGVDKQHNINASFGFEANSTKYDGFSAITRGYMKNRGKAYVTDIDLTEYTKYAEWLSSNVPTVTDDLTNLLSEYGTASYSYRDYFTVNGNMRFDSSNKFGDQSNNRVLPIWSASFMYNLASLTKNVRAIDYMRLKTSYGFQGNMLDGLSPKTIIKAEALNTTYGEYTSTISSYPDPNLKWEKTRSINVSLNTGLWNNRFQSELSYFYKETEDAFIERPVSAINGINTYMVNGGDITNEGYTVDLTIVPIRSKDWFWTVSGSLTKIENRMKSNAGVDAYELEDFLNGTAIIEGEAIGTFYSYDFIGLNPEDGGPMFNDGDEASIANLSKYDTYTQVLLKSGRRDPNVTGGINTSLRYKKWRFNANFTFSLGAKTRLLKFYPNGNDYSPQYNMNRDLINRWRQPGDENKTNIPAVIDYYVGYDPSYDNHWSVETSNWGTTQLVANTSWDEYNYSDIRVVSADYLQCTYLSLTYGLSDKLLEKLRMARAELTLSSSNVFTIADKALKGQTPTQSGFDEVQLSQRPTFSLGLSVTF